jgi:formylglycine-generating enzyme required for sulfatase activity
MTDSALAHGLGKQMIRTGAIAFLPWLVWIACGGLASLAHLDDAARAQAKPDTNKVPPGDLALVEIAADIKMRFCWVPPGKATLGSPATEIGRGGDHEDDETEHEFISRGFWIAKFPVTQEEWRALMRDNPSPSYFKPEQDDVKKAGITDTSRFPVEKVSWDDCQDFLKAMTARAKAAAKMGRGRFVLPREDEWEYACRGGKGNERPFYFGNRLSGDLANCDGNFPYGSDTKGDYKRRTTQVGDYAKVAPHPWGLCDMHGNVWQWCEGPSESDKDSMVIRGGSWYRGAALCRSASRSSFPAGSRLSSLGFRVCFRPD